MQSPKFTKPKSTTPKSRQRSTSGLSKKSNSSVIRKEPEPTILVRTRVDSWTKADEILNHLALTSFKDNRPPKLQKMIRTKLMISRKALQRRANPVAITKPLLELAAIVEEQGLETGNTMNKQLQVIRTCLSQAKKENFEDRAVESLRSSSRLKDPKGLQMKKLLDGARTLLDRMTDLNELQINLTNSVEVMLKNSGYLLENESFTIHKLDVSSKTLDRKKNIDKPQVFSSYNWKKIQGVLDHLMRVCQRPNIAPDLQQTILSKISTARKSLQMKEDPLQISKHLHEMIDIVNSHGFHSGEAMHSRLEGMNNPFEYSTGGFAQETVDSIPLGSAMTGLELRKVLDQTKSCISYLSDLNELKMIIRTSADLILQGSPLQQLPWMDKTLEIGDLFNLVDMTALPGSLKSAVRVTLSKARTALCTRGGQEALIGPLEVMSWALKEQAPDFVTRACNGLLIAVGAYNKRKQLQSYNSK